MTAHRSSTPCTAWGSCAPSPDGRSRLPFTRAVVLGDHANLVLRHPITDERHEDARPLTCCTSISKKLSRIRPARRGSRLDDQRESDHHLYTSQTEPLGFDHMFVAVDETSAGRLTEVLPDKGVTTCEAFLHRALDEHTAHSEDAHRSAGLASDAVRQALQSGRRSGRARRGAATQPEGLPIPISRAAASAPYPGVPQARRPSSSPIVLLRYATNAGAARGGRPS